MYDIDMSTRSVAIASCVTVAAGFGLMAIHYFGGDPNDPEGWFSAVGFGAPFVGAGGISLTGIRADKRGLCLAGAVALAVMSIVSIVMFPLIAAAAVMAVGSQRSLNSESLAIPATLGLALVGVFAMLVFHQDPVAWSSPKGSGSSSNVVTSAEAATSLAVVIVAMASSVAWSTRHPGARSHHVADDNVSASEG